MQLLDPSALLEQLPKLLPTSNNTSEDSTQNESGQKIRTPHDALAILVHTILTRLSFRLTSLSDIPSETKVENHQDNILPSNWNAAGPGTYTFRYAHEQSSLTFIVKIISLGARILIHATALESNRTESYEVELDRFTSRNYWPWPQSSSSSNNEPLVNGFVSSSRLADFVFGFQVKIIQKLIPGLRKDGYEEINESDQGSSAGPSQQPSSNRPARPHYPEHDPDEAYPSAFAPRRDPLIVGDRDLDPLGGGGRMGGGFGPPPLFGGGPGRMPGGDDGGGMIVGPNHPMFRDRFQQPQGGGIGPGGGIVPPGARFDPTGPFGFPGRPGGGGGGNGPFGPVGGRGPRRPNLGDPDWDDMPPPGNSNNDYDNMFM